MDSVTLDDLKSIEKNIKKVLITEYNSFIPKEKADFWLSNNYFNKSNYNSNKSLSKYQGELLRYLFSEIINIEVNNNVESKNLQEGFVEYYVENFADKNDIEINKRPDLKNKIKMATEISNKLDKKTNKLIFTSNYDTLIKELNVLNNNSEQIIISNKVKPSLTLIYKNNEQFIKYIDEDGETHLVKSNNPKKVSKLYKKLSNKNTDIEDMFNKLINIPKDKEEKITNEEIDMLDFIPSKNTENDKIEIDEDVINDVISNITLNENEETINNVIESNIGVIENQDDDTNMDETNELDNSDVNSLDDNENENLESNDIVESNVDVIENQDDDTNMNETNEIDNSVVNSLGDIENENIESDDIVESNVDVIENQGDDTSIDETNELDNSDVNSLDNVEDITDNQNEDTNSDENKKDNMYMLFYIFAITISVALIIGIIILKYFS